jgi:acyl phosphate:glycerol-3-phosphate acyltransferase
MIFALIVLGYLFGSFPTGVLVGRIWRFDPRAIGSGNVGMTNVARGGGALPAALTFAGDALKGLIPILIAKALGINNPGVLAAVALAAVVGAIASIFLKFRGGKGVATSAGIWLGLAPLALVIALAVFIAILALSRIVSLSSIGAAVSLPAAVAAVGSPRHYILLAIVISALVLARHYENIGRLMRNEEPRVGVS